jgi:hypothetical protein|tara:strand:+ start:13919 stop:14344 length:426 start_codon:yes stop_codon:yes gene_type:complete
MKKNSQKQEVPEYFKPARGTIMDYYRLVSNKHKWPNYLVTTYRNTYEGFDDIFKFRLALDKRIPFDYNARLREHVVKKSNQKFVNHGRDGLEESFFLEDHHTLLHILVSKRVDTLHLMYDTIKFKEEVDPYLTITRDFYYE